MFCKSVVMAREAYDFRFRHLFVRFTPHLWRESAHGVYVCRDMDTGDCHKVYEMTFAWFWVVYDCSTR